MDYYSILGVDRTATAEEIKLAFKKLAKQHHPDRGGDPEKFKSINQAYTALSNAQKHSTNTSRTFNTNDFAEFNTFFKDIFGSSAGFHHSQYAQPKNRNLQATVAVDLADIFQPQRRTLHLKTGRSEKVVEVDIPAGINNGATIRYTGYGQDVLTNAPPGDLVVTIHIKENPLFERVAADLHSTITVDAIDAMLGASKEFVNIDGAKLTVQIPAGIQPGQSLRVAGRGLPRTNNDQRGNLLLKVQIAIAQNLTEDQKNLLRQFQNH
jgi:curved DNA-binding protein